MNVHALLYCTSIRLFKNRPHESIADGLRYVLAPALGMMVLTREHGRIFTTRCLPKINEAGVCGYEDVSHISRFVLSVPRPNYNGDIIQSIIRLKYKQQIGDDRRQNIIIVIQRAAA